MAPAASEEAPVKPEHLLVVGQEVVGVRQGVGDPRPACPGPPGARRSSEVVAPIDLAWASSLPAASPPRNSGPPRWRWEMPSRSDRSRSSRVKAPLAPMQCHAGRSPLGRTGITGDEVCWSAFSRPAPRPRRPRLGACPAGSSPSGSSRPRRSCAPRLRAGSARPPCRRQCRPARTGWSPPAVPSEPSGTDSTPITCASRTWTPTVAIFMTSPGVRAGRAVVASTSWTWCRSCAAVPA